MFAVTVDEARDDVRLAKYNLAVAIEKTKRAESLMEEMRLLFLERQESERYAYAQVTHAKNTLQAFL